MSKFFAVEFIPLDPQGRKFPFSEWRALSGDEILLRVSLNTAVAEWLIEGLLFWARVLLWFCHHIVALAV